MDLPVGDVDASVPFYEKVFGFTRDGAGEPSGGIKRVVLARDDVKIALAENGGDPEQDGAAFEVDNAAAAHAELKANGLEKLGEIKTERRDDGSVWQAFFVIAPDGLCFWVGERTN
jgi:predicted enzyme related to lactoylglutathione lyase